ncbi:MAG: uridine diphosphate-N-acetylglucosamine-binding protein YvcK [Nocardioidaceae bacterium]
MIGPLVVALGGGHGLAASLEALRRITQQLTAVVTVADNGGSSGRLREEFGVLPPGDLRMALAALCGDDRWGQTWARVLQHRFQSSGDLNGHSVGNVLIVALWELLHDQVEGLDWIADLLDARGRVLPMSKEPLEITAVIEELGSLDRSQRVKVIGQAEVATSAGRVCSVALEPANPSACGVALEAVAEADWVVMGPGSWYTSVIPHLLVPQLRAALTTTPANLILTMNLEAHTAETRGFDTVDHLRVIREYAADLQIHTILVDPTAVGDETRLIAEVAELGANLLVADVASASAGVHDPEKLALAYTQIMASP